jgi:hypothetical protein
MCDENDVVISKYSLEYFEQLINFVNSSPIIRAEFDKFTRLRESVSKRKED